MSNQGSWQPSDDATSIHLQNKDQDWNQFGKDIKEVEDEKENAISQKASIERRKWVIEEDEQLIKLVKKYGTKNWRIIASNLSGRLPKQCRERWINHLDPSIIKGRLTEEEWQIVLNAHKELGNKWSEIAKKLPGRTPNQIKNHWHAMVRKTNKRKKSSDSPPPSTLSPPLSPSFGNKSLNYQMEKSAYSSLDPSTVNIWNIDIGYIYKKRKLRNNKPSKLDALIEISEFVYQAEMCGNPVDLTIEYLNQNGIKMDTTSFQYFEE